MNKSLLTVLALSSAMLLASCQPTPAASSGAPEGDGSGASAQSSAAKDPMTLEAFFSKLDGHNVTAKIEGYFDGYFVSNELVALDYGEDGFEAYAKIEDQGIAYFGKNTAGDIVFGGFETPNANAKIQDDILYAPVYLLEAEDSWTKSTSAAGTYVLEDIESFAAGIVSLVGYNSDSAEYIASVKLKLEAEVANLEVTFNDGYGGTVKETLVMSDFGTTTYDGLPAAALEEAKGYTKDNWDAEEVSFLENYYFGAGNASKFPFAGNFSKYVSWDLDHFEDYGMATLMDANPVKSIEELIASLKGLNVGWRESEYMAEHNDLSNADSKVWGLELPLAEGSNEVVLIMINEVSATGVGTTMYPNGMLSVSLMGYQYPIEGLDAINAALANVTIDVTAGSAVKFVAFPAAEVVTNAIYQDATESYEQYMQMMLSVYSIELPDGVSVFEYYHAVEFKFADADQGIAYLDAYKDSLVALGFCAVDNDGNVVTPTPTVAAAGSVVLYSTDDLTSIAIGYVTDEDTGEVTYYVEISRYTQGYVDFLNTLQA